MIALLNRLTGKQTVNIGSTDGGLNVLGLGRKAVLQTPGTYNTTPILGYEVLVPGSGNWSVTFGTDSPILLTAASRIQGAVYPEHLTSITVPAGGSALLFIPEV